MEKEYLSCAETAKLVRAALKKKFPGVKFSVRSDVYSGGASIDVRWVLGPTTKEVDEIAGQYESASFDGSIDMETRYDHWLLPDGSAVVRSGPGTEGSLGYIPAVNNPMPEGARPVSFGAHYVQCQRSYADHYEHDGDLVNKIAEDMCALQHVKWEGPNLTVNLFGDADSEQAVQHAWRLLHATSFSPCESYAGVRFLAKGEDGPEFNLPFIVIKTSMSDAQTKSPQEKRKELDGDEPVFCPKYGSENLEENGMPLYTESRGKCLDCG